MGLACARCCVRGRGGTVRELDGTGAWTGEEELGEDFGFVVRHLILIF